MDTVLDTAVRQVATQAPRFLEGYLMFKAAGIFQWLGAYFLKSGSPSFCSWCEPLFVAGLTLAMAKGGKRKGKGPSKGPPTPSPARAAGGQFGRAPCPPCVGQRSRYGCKTPGLATHRITSTRDLGLKMCTDAKAAGEQLYWCIECRSKSHRLLGSRASPDGDGDPSTSSEMAPAHSQDHSGCSTGQ